MDSFYEPSNSRQRAELALSLADVREQIHSLKREYASKDIPLSGRVLHAVHYLPVSASLASRTGAITPPLTPPIRPADIPSDLDKSESVTEGKWTLTPRWGHSAMISGILSLSDVGEQVILGWAGDIGSGASGDNVKVEAAAASA